MMGLDRDQTTVPGMGCDQPSQAARRHRDVGVEEQ